MPDPCHVLLADDDPVDVELTSEILRLSGDWAGVHVVGDGEQALGFLRRTPGYTDAPRPSLILLDINMPRLSGLEVLAVVKADAGLLSIPVVMFSTSAHDTDINASYNLHANGYVTKPRDYDGFEAALMQISRFFLSTVQRCPIGSAPWDKSG